MKIRIRTGLVNAEAGMIQLKGKDEGQWKKMDVDVQLEVQKWDFRDRGVRAPRQSKKKPSGVNVRETRRGR